MPVTAVPMVQIKEISVGNVKVTIAEMPYRVGKKHIEEGRDLINQGDQVPDSIWMERSAATIADSFNRANGSDGNTAPEDKWTTEAVLDTFGLGTMNEIYRQILILSGLRLPDGGSAPGEAKAA